MFPQERYLQHGDGLVTYPWSHLTDEGSHCHGDWLEVSFLRELQPGESCEGWEAGQIEDLWRKVNAEWEKYGCLVGNLPPELRERFLRIHDAALEKARAAGWDADRELVGD